MYAGCSCPTSSAAEQRSCNICGVVKPVSGFTGANKNCILCLANVKARRQQRACRTHPSTSSDASNDLLPSASCCTLDDSLHAHMHILHEFVDTFPAHCQEQLREVLSYDIMRNKEECLVALDLLLHLLGQGAGCTDCAHETSGSTSTNSSNYDHECFRTYCAFQKWIQEVAYNEGVKYNVKSDVHGSAVDISAPGFDSKDPATWKIKSNMSAQCSVFRSIRLVCWCSNYKYGSNVGGESQDESQETPGEAQGDFIARCKASANKKTRKSTSYLGKCQTKCDRVVTATQHIVRKGNMVTLGGFVVRVHGAHDGCAKFRQRIPLHPDIRAWILEMLEAKHTPMQIYEYLCNPSSIPKCVVSPPIPKYHRPEIGVDGGSCSQYEATLHQIHWLHSQLKASKRACKDEMTSVRVMLQKLSKGLAPSTLPTAAQAEALTCIYWQEEQCACPTGATTGVIVFLFLYVFEHVHFVVRCVP